MQRRIRQGAWLARGMPWGCTTWPAGCSCHHRLLTSLLPRGLTLSLPQVRAKDRLWFSFGMLPVHPSVACPAQIDDLYERRVDTWIRDFAGASHVLDVYRQKRVDKRKVFASNYTHLRGLGGDPA